MFSKRFKKILAKTLIVSLCFTGKGTFCFLKNIKTYANEIKNTDHDIQYEREISKILGWNGGSKETGENSIISSEFVFASLDYTGREDKSTFYYTDDYFKNASTTYNNHLSTMSIELALSGVGSYQEDEKDKYGNAKDVLSKIGFENISPNSDFLNRPEKETMGSVCANKHIYLKEGGTVKEYNLMAVVMRSANYEKEWVSNFKIGKSGDHVGFSESRDKVYNHISTFYNEHKDDFGNLPVKLWVVGYSRGAAVANMLGAKLTDNSDSFKTTKEDIYCYTLGTPKGVLISAHATPLDSYNNIHNVVSAADALQMVTMTTLGFGRYGVDHEIPYFASDKVHDQAKKTEKQNQNSAYMPKYEKMISKLMKIDPSIALDLNDFKMYKLVLIDLDNFAFLNFSRYGEEPFTDTSSENEYYQTYEFFDTFINRVFGEELVSCAYPGTDYASTTGRQRYYEKYQDLIGFALSIFMSGDSIDGLVEKIKQNAMSNLMVLMGLLGIAKELIYREREPQARDHFIPGYEEGQTYSESDYQDGYEMMRLAYEALFAGAFPDEDYNFLMSRHRDLTDMLLDVLNVDYRTTLLPKQSMIGTIYQNLKLYASMHKGAFYLSWLQSEDEYFDTAPADTISYEGMKTVTFTDLSDSTIEFYDSNDNKICEYTIDSSKNITYTELIENKYIDVAKSYNPEGLEIRLPSNVNYKGILRANKSLGTAIYREYFVADATFYRKEKQLGNIVLNDSQHYEMIFNESSVSKVFSCYNVSDLTPYKEATFTKVKVKKEEKGSGYDSYSFGAEPQFTIKNDLLALSMNKELIASNSEIMEEEEIEVASPSEVETEVASPSSCTGESPRTGELREPQVETSETDQSESSHTGEPQDETSETDQSESLSTDEQSEPPHTDEQSEPPHTDEQSESPRTGELREPQDETSEIELHKPQEVSEAEEETVSGFIGTFGTTEKYVVNFTTMAEGDFYYDDGSGFVKGTSGDSYEAGTKIKFTAPFTYDNRPFYGWTLTDESGNYINAKGVDTPKIYDESNATNSTYILELKDYNINILANYQFKEYKLTLSVDTSKGTIEPEGTALEYISVADFDSIKDDVSIVNVNKNEFLYWSDGKVNYATLSDYTWTYKSNVTLKAVFKSNKPIVPSGGGGSSGGGDVVDSLSGPMSNQEKNNYVINTLLGKNVYNKIPGGKWVSEKVLNQEDFYRYEVNEDTTIDIINKEFETVNVGSKKYLSNGLYKITTADGRGYYYLFDSIGVMQTGFKKLNDKIYYFEESGANKGAMVQGEKIINGILNRFDKDGSLIQDNVLQVVEGFWFYHPNINRWEYYVQGLNGSNFKLINGTYAIKDAAKNFTNFEFDEFGFLKSN